MRARRPRVDGEELRESFQPRMWIRLTAFSLLIAFTVAFILENSRHVHVHFVFATTSVSLIWVILLCLVLGALAGIGASQLYRHRRRHRGKPGDPV